MCGSSTLPGVISARRSDSMNRSDRRWLELSIASKLVLGQRHPRVPGRSLAARKGLEANTSVVERRGRSCRGFWLFGRDLRMPLGGAGALLDELIGLAGALLQSEGIIEVYPDAVCASRRSVSPSMEMTW